jgi:hypothetical protein
VATEDEDTSNDSKNIRPVQKNFKSSTGQLKLFLCPGHYTQENVATMPTADVVVMFNPGLTCPDYPKWNDTLHCIPNGTPLLLLTNTQMEVLADIQFLLEHGHLKLSSLPPPWLEISAEEDETKNSESDAYYWGENPYCGWRVRQSGTLANDVYVKNRWMFRGFVDRCAGLPSRVQAPTNSNSPSLQDVGLVTNRTRATSSRESESPKKKRKLSSGTANENSKRSNPALI